MRRQPITLSVSPVAWTAPLHAAQPRATPPTGQPCHHCGDPAPVGPTFATGKTACLLCLAPQSLGRDTIAQEAMLIRAPRIDGRTLSQAALNRLVLAIHRTFVAQGEAPCLDAQPTTDTVPLRGAYRAYSALAALAPAAEKLVGTTSPRDLGAALLGLRGRPEVLDSLRLLHQGRHFSAGRDVYRDLLAATLPA